MPFPETTAAQARKLVKSFAPFQVYIGGQGFVLSAKVEEAGLQPVARQVDGKWTWVDEPAFNVVFSGGKWGSHTLRCATSSLKRIAAHWDGYKVAHTQEVTRIDRVAPLMPAVPSRPQGWKPEVGDKVWFHRGMFGKWQGTIRSLYRARGPRYGSLGAPKGALLADVSFRGRNGRGYVYARVEAATLTQNGRRPDPEGM